MWRRGFIAKAVALLAAPFARPRTFTVVGTLDLEARRHLAALVRSIREDE